MANNTETKTFICQRDGMHFTVDAAFSHNVTTCPFCGKHEVIQ